MSLERFNSSDQINQNSAHSAKALYERDLKIAHANNERLAKEKIYEAQDHEKIKLLKMQIEELRQWKEQQIQSAKLADKREKLNTALAVAGILIALVSLLK